MKKSSIKDIYPCFGTPQYTATSAVCKRCQFREKCWKIVKVKYALHKKYFDLLSEEELISAKKKKKYKEVKRKKRRLKWTRK